MEFLSKVRIIHPDEKVPGGAQIELVLGSLPQFLTVELKADFEGSNAADLKALALERLIQDLRAAADGIEEGLQQLRR